MEIQARPYRDNTDLTNMRHLLMTGVQANIQASYTHPGTLDWATHHPPDEEARRRNLRLWERVGQNPPWLAAWAIFLPHEETFDLFVHPTIYGTPLHETVMDAYVAWAETRAREAGLKHIWPFWAMDYDKVLETLMTARGFEILPADPPPPLFERALDELPPVQLPDGFTVQGVKGLEDGRLRASVAHAAFGYQDDLDSYAATYAQFISSEVYDGERDLIVRSPDGQGAAACTLWFDPVNKVGLFEPVATHPDYQGKGLGKAVMAEGMSRMKAAGMERAIVGFDPGNAAALALYTSMGFQASAYFVIYRKTLSVES